MKKAYEHGWAGGIMKTAFDGLHIHIPNEYMTKVRVLKKKTISTFWRYQLNFV